MYRLINTPQVCCASVLSSVCSNGHIRKGLLQLLFSKMTERVEQLPQKGQRNPGLSSLEKRCTIMFYQITKVLCELNVTHRFVTSCHVRIKGHLIYLTEAIFCLNKRSAESRQWCFFNLPLQISGACCHGRCRVGQFRQVPKGFMCMHPHQVLKWTLNRLRREVPSEFLLRNLWVPAERLAHVLAQNSICLCCCQKWNAKLDTLHT